MSECFKRMADRVWDCEWSLISTPVSSSLSQPSDLNAAQTGPKQEKLRINSPRVVLLPVLSWEIPIAIFSLLWLQMGLKRPWLFGFNHSRNDYSLFSKQPLYHRRSAQPLFGSCLLVQSHGFGSHPQSSHWIFFFLCEFLWVLFLSFLFRT